MKTWLGLWATILALAVSVTAHAQVEDDAVTVPVEVSLQGTTDISDYDNPANVYISGGSLGTVYASTDVAGDFSASGLLKLRPGKAYLIPVSSYAVTALAVHIHPPSGYHVYVDRVERQKLDFNADGQPYIDSYQTFILRVDDGSSLPFGAATSLRPSRIVWSLGMGTLRNGKSAGVIGLRQDDLSSIVCSPSALYYDIDSTEVEVINDGSGNLRQVYATNGLADIAIVNAYSYKIRFFTRASGAISSDKTDGVYTFSGDPLYEYLVQNPDSGSASNRLRITKTIVQGGDTQLLATEMTKQSSTQWNIADWAEMPSGFTTVTGPVLQNWLYGTNGSVATEFLTIADDHNVVAFVSYKEYTTYAWGVELTKEIIGEPVLGQIQVETDYAYYTDPGRPGAYRRLQSTQSSDGSWIVYDYYDDLSRRGQIKRVYRPYLNSPTSSSSASDSVGEATIIDYDDDWTGKAILPKSIETRVNGVTTSKREISYSTENYTDNSLGYARTLPLIVATRKDYTDASNYLTSVSKIFRQDADQENHFFPGIVHSTRAADGTMTVQAFLRGLYNPSMRSFTPVAGASEWMQVSFTGTSSSSGNQALGSYGPNDQNPGLESNFYVAPGKSTANAVVHAADGMVVWTQTQTCESSSSWPIINRCITAYLDGVFPWYSSCDTGDPYTNWTVASNEWSKGRLNASTDAIGTTTYYTYDAANRVSGTVRAGSTGAGVYIPDITNTMAYDAVGHVTNRTVGTPAEYLSEAHAYNWAGMLTQVQQPGLGSTSYTYTLTPTLRRTTKTLPTGATEITDLYADGKVKSVTGTAVVAHYPSYSVQSDGTQYTLLRLSTATSSRLQENWTDWIGRTKKSSHPGFTGQPAIEEIPTYNASTGQLQKTTRTGYAATLLIYNSVGQLIRSGLDLNASGSLDLASNDRIGDAGDYIEKIGTDFWATSTKTIYPQGGSSVGVTQSVVRKRLTGLTSSLREETQTTDIEGNTSVRTVFANGGGVVTISTSSPGMVNSAIEQYVNGMLVSSTSVDGLTCLRNYDDLGRLVSISDPRTGTSSVNYYSQTALEHQRIDAAGIVVSDISYDGNGRVQRVLDAAGKSVRYEYDSMGHVVHQWGTGTYPRAYGYDEYGQRVTMTTYRASGAVDWDSDTWPAGSLTGDTTTWVYDGPSGLLVKKIDAAGKFVEYDYNQKGQTAHRYWSRLTGANRVTSTYSYWGDDTGEPQTGELKSIAYNDGTPGVYYSYSRLGQIESVTDAAGTREFVYNSAKPWRLSAEALDTFYGSRVISQMYQEITSTDNGDSSYTGHVIGSVTGRLIGYGLGTSSTPAADLQVTMAVSNLGRIAGFATTRTNGAAQRKFVYGYEGNSRLVASTSVVGNAFFVTRTYESQRDLLSSIESKWSALSLTKFDYQYDGRRLRTSVVQTGDAYSDYGDAIHQIYDYADRGEMRSASTYLGDIPDDISSPLSGRQHSFSYDAIGNRLTSNTSSDSGTADSYETNSRNQYSSRDNHTVTAGGVADTDAVVAVFSTTPATPAGRAGRHWGDLVAVDNVGHPFAGNLSMFAARPGMGSGGADLVRTENRTLLTASDPQLFIYDEDGNLTDDGLWTYRYDAENRLVGMETTSVARSFNAPWRVLLFKYDAQGRRIEKKVLNGTTLETLFYRRFIYNAWSLIEEIDGVSLETKRIFTRNEDTAGGLSEIYDVELNRSFFPTYDGNGNVSSLVNADTGAYEATYEYSPFGELLRCEGNYALSNPFRFSTCYQDDETKLIYYGQRYYSPSLGRFINRDPIAEQGGLNLYGFCGNDGVNHTDYLGYSWLSRLLKFGRKATRDLLNVATLGALRAPINHLYTWGENHQRELKIAAAIVAAIVTYGAASEWAATELAGSQLSIGATWSATTVGTASGAVGGAAAGAVSGLIMTGTVRGTLQGAASGAIMGGIAGYYGRAWTLGRVATTTVGGGLASEVSGGSFRQGATISGAIALVTYGAIKMREYEVAHSPKENLGRASAGFNGDSESLAGSRDDVRIDPQTGQITTNANELPFGGSQGREGKLFGKLYQPNSWQDRLLEAYAGPHDFLGHPWGYNAAGYNDAAHSLFGRYIAAATTAGIAEKASTVMSGIDLLLATPIVATSAIGVSPAAMISILQPPPNR